MSQSSQSLHLWLSQHIFLIFTKYASAVAEAMTLQRHTSASGFSYMFTCIALSCMWPQESGPTSRTKIDLHSGQEDFGELLHRD